MRRLLVLFSFAALALAASAPALPANLASSTRVRGSEGLELSGGNGYAVLAERGAAVGNVRRGWIRVLNIAGGGVPSGWVRGCDRRSGRLSGRLYCAGTGLRFWIHGGTWRIRIKGNGINASAVLRGSVGLERAACRGCTFKIGDGSRRRWPARLKFYALRD